VTGGGAYPGGGFRTASRGVSGTFPIRASTRSTISWMRRSSMSMEGLDLTPKFDHGGPMDLDALLAHARALVGAELGDLADALGLPVPHGRVRTKGWSGQIIEHELGAAVGGPQLGPDFASLGVELKTVPVTADLTPTESTAVCQIDPVAIAAESWETSYVRAKLARVLFVALEVAATVGERRVAAVRLWSPSPADDRRLRADFELFVRDYFRRGRATDITGHLGAALQVRPKGRDAADLRDAYDADGQPTRIGKMGFYLRPAFVARIIGR
jgi:DNA mismatch repair protein MutH